MTAARRKRSPLEKICNQENCGKQFSTNVINQKTCPDCLKKRRDKIFEARRLRAGKRLDSPRNAICHVSAGAISELKACAYFLQEGYYVYRNVAPNSPFDLAIFKPGEPLLKVEVVSGRYQSDGGPYISKKPEYYDFDLLCLVMPDGAVELVDRETYRESIASKQKHKR